MLRPTLEFITSPSRLAQRPPDSHKGMFGRVLVVAGSRGMSGAAALSAGAALRGGAGLVRVAVPRGIWPIVAAANPCYMAEPLPEDAAGRFESSALAPLLELVRDQSIVAIGPGLGRSEAVTQLVLALLAEAAVPIVLDADGLNAVHGRLDRLRGRTKPSILTPHPGELARLLNITTEEVQKRRSDVAVEFAFEHGVILVLKGHGTIVTDGSRFYQNTTGNPGMATGGSGDVLTGVIAALLGQGMEPFAAAQLGVFVHGRAGDLAREKLGEVSLIASDLLDYLPRAFQNL